MKLKFNKNIFEIGEKELVKIISENFRKLQAKEFSEGILVNGGVGLFASTMQQNIPPCFGCGSFRDYTGECNYASKVKVLADNKEKNLCQVQDTPLVHAIQQGELDAYRR